MHPLHNHVSPDVIPAACGANSFEFKWAAFLLKFFEGWSEGSWMNDYCVHLIVSLVKDSLKSLTHFQYG